MRRRWQVGESEEEVVGVEEVAGEEDRNSAQKVEPGEENSGAAVCARTRTRDLSIVTSLSFYH